MSSPASGLVSTPTIYANVDFGPTFGSVYRPINQQRTVTAAGSVTVLPFDNLIKIKKDTPEATTVYLPNLNQWMIQPYGGFQLIVVDGAFEAGTYPITVTPFSGQKINNEITSAVMAVNGAVGIFIPQLNLDGWIYYGSAENDAIQTTFDTVADVHAAFISLLADAVQTYGYAAAGDGGGNLYKRVGSEPTHVAKVQSADGAWWEAVPDWDGFNVCAIGFKADSQRNGSTGTDNSAALQNAIDTQFPQLKFPDGFARFSTPINLWGSDADNMSQHFRGTSRRPTDSSRQLGSVLIYYGTGVAAGVAVFSSPAGQGFTNNVFSGITFYAVDGSDALYLLRMYDGANNSFEDCFFSNQNEALFADADTTGGSCVQNLVNSPKITGNKTWQNWFLNCKFECNTSRTTPIADSAGLAGQAWGINIEGNDIFLTHCHFSNATARGWRSGAIYATNCDFENTSAGQLDGSSDPADSGRSLIMLSNEIIVEADVDKNTISGTFASCSFNQGSRAFVIDASAGTSDIDVSVVITGCKFRRNWVADIQLVGNDLGGETTGGIITGCSFVGPYNFNLDPAIDDSTSVTREPRIIYSGGVWQGFRISGSVRGIPDDWAEFRGQNIQWLPQLDSTTVVVNGLAVTEVGASHAGNTIVATNYLTQSGPRYTVTSDTPNGSAAELYGAAYTCWRGNVAGLGGFYARFRFGTSTIGVGCRGFFGLASTTSALANAEPTTFTQVVGLYFDTTDTNWKMTFCSAGTQVSEDLGSDFPVDDSSVYEIEIWAAPNGERVVLKARKLGDQTILPIVRYHKNRIPDATSLLSPHMWVNNGVTGAAVAFDLIGMQIRTGYGDVFAGAI